MSNLQLNATKRTKTGKGQARKLRSMGQLPAILYGPDTSPIILSIDYMQLEKALKGRSAENIIFDLRIDSDEEKESKRVMIKEMQKVPVTRDYLHIDFYEIPIGKEIEADIPVNLMNTPIGVINGGILQHIRRVLSISCMPEDLVDKIDIDVSTLDTGQSLHIGDISLPPGLKSMENEDLTIATVVAPTIEEEEVEEEEVEEEEEAGEAESEEIKGEEKS